MFKIFTASLGGFQFGYNAAIISGAILYLKESFNLNPLMEGFVVSIMLIGGLIGSPIAGMCADRFGRKKTLALTALLFLIGALWAYLAGSIFDILGARLVQGIAIAIAGIVPPLYLAELAPPQSRGAWVTTNQLAVTLGFLVAYVANYYWCHTCDWRSMFGSGAIFALLQLVLLFFIPESPSWKKTDSTSWSALLDKRHRMILFLGIIVSIFQQVTGINTVLYYAPRILQHAGIEGHAMSILATVGIGLVNFFATIFSIWLLDKVGRKPILLWSLAGMALNIAILAFSLFVQSDMVDTIAVVTQMAYVASYAIGLGPIPALLYAELFPYQIRSRGMGLTSITGMAANFALSFSFLSLCNLLTPGGVFFIFAALGIASFIFTWKWIPETKNRPI